VLLTLLTKEDEEKADASWSDLRTRILLSALTPDQIPKLLEVLDGEKREAELGMPEFAPQLSDEEMEGYELFSHEEANEAIDMMRRFGIAVQGD
jgi:hypothetical protein